MSTAPQNTLLQQTYVRVTALSQRLFQLCEETNAQLQNNRKKRIAWFVEKDRKPTKESI